MDAALIEAHRRGDKEALVDLYERAGSDALDIGNIEAGCFYITHAYIFALETGSKATGRLHGLLTRLGRER